MRSHARDARSAQTCHRGQCLRVGARFHWVRQHQRRFCVSRKRLADLFDPLDYRGLADTSELQTLAKGACAPEEKAQPISLQQTPSQNIEAKVQLLASQNALPVMYAADNPDIEPGGPLYKRGDVLDISTALKKLGLSSDMTSIALSTTQEQFAGTVPSVPFQMNIEGLFYNKKIFAQHGISRADDVHAAPGRRGQAQGRRSPSIQRFWCVRMADQPLGRHPFVPRAGPERHEGGG